MVNDRPEPRFEPPLVKPLYVTFRRASELLGEPYWQIPGLAYVLETRYFGERGGSPRILLSSIEEFIQLRDDGQDARQVLASRKHFNGWSPSARQPQWARPVDDPRTRHWRKHWYYNR